MEDLCVLPIAAILFAAVVIPALWIMFRQRKLVVLDEDACCAMNRIGVQLSNRCDALIALLVLTKGYNRQESESMMEIIRSKRMVITAKSTPEDVLRQLAMMNDALGKVARITEQYPEIKANRIYIKTMEAIQTFESRARSCCVDYNRCVTKLNREIGRFPVNLVAGMLGFHQRVCLQEINQS